MTAAKPRTLFLVHRFDTKSLEDSAGVVEVMRPMLASGLLGEHRLISLGRDTADYISLIEARMADILAQSGTDPVVIYGAGAHTRQFYPQLGKARVVAIADRDESLWGTTVLGHPVIAPAQIPAHARHVIISSRAYEEGIAKDLQVAFGSNVRIHPLYGRNPDGELRQQWEGLIRNTVADFRPDLLVHTPVHPHENLSASFFLDLRRLHPDMQCLTLWWDYDEAAHQGSYLDYERETLRWADLVIENSNVTRLERMRQGISPYEQHQDTDKVIFHPTIFDPALFYPEPDQAPLYDIALFGSSVGRRREWIDLLKARYGERFHHLGGVYEKDRPPLPIAEYAQALRRTRICINTQTYPFRNQCKGKVREALACGTLLLEEDNPETRCILCDGEGLRYFRNADELFRLIDHYLATPTDYQAVIAKGQQVWAEDYSPARWTQTILQQLNLASPQTLGLRHV
ncbi:glycosyltransferase [Uliginosibacterium gangwonense]|uniref:glycosyltransferase n=1 Tax=Uliginosibacterium gangwonense TaxID=392736 RepID=UPI00039EA532|nr:glycosyltransferase [Uliginosibacterium gangwonense]